MGWSDGASDITVTCPNNTNRNQVTLQFTPTEAGVVVDAVSIRVAGCAGDGVVAAAVVDAGVVAQKVELIQIGVSLAG